MSRGSLADTRKAPTCVSAGQRLACSLSQQCPEGDLPEQSIWGYDPLLKCYWAALWRDEDHPQVRESHHAQAHLLPHPDIRAVTNHGRGRGSWARPTCGSPHSWGQRPHQGPVSHTTLRDATRSSHLLTQPRRGCSVKGTVLTLAGRRSAEVAESTPEDVELALDAAHAAKDAWGEASATERAAVLNAIADAIEQNTEMLAVAESWENGKPIRETLNADIPLVVDHFRYFAAEARAEEGTSTEIDKDMVAYHFREPLGVVGQIVPFNFPLLMAAWKLAPALAAGNCSVLKPASPTPWSILKLMEVIEDVVPPGVINVVTGPGAEIGKALAANPRIAKIAFTGETVTGRGIMQYAAQNLNPSNTELGGESPNIFFSDVMAHDDEFLDKAIEGLVLYAFNKGEVCTAPSRALIQEDIYDAFMARCLARIAVIKQGDPLDTETMIGPQVSRAQIEKIASYVDIGRAEGAEVLIGGHRAVMAGEFADGYYYE